MPAHRGPNWLTVTPVAGAGGYDIAAMVHVNGGDLALAVIVTLVAAIAGIVSALAPHLPALCRERSHAQIVRAVIEHQLSADEAVRLIGGRPDDRVSRTVVGVDSPREAVPHL